MWIGKLTTNIQSTTQVFSGEKYAKAVPMIVLNLTISRCCQCRHTLYLMNYIQQAALQTANCKMFSLQCVFSWLTKKSKCNSFYNNALSLSSVYVNINKLCVMFEHEHVLRYVFYLYNRPSPVKIIIIITKICIESCHEVTRVWWMGWT